MVSAPVVRLRRKLHVEEEEDHNRRGVEVHTNRRHRDDSAGEHVVVLVVYHHSVDNKPVEGVHADHCGKNHNTQRC